MAAGRLEDAAHPSVWRVPGVMAAAAHVLLVPLYFAVRWWDLSRQPFGLGHWPGEPAWPAGSGSSEYGPGVLPLIGVWLLLLVLVLCACTVAGLVALTGRFRRFLGGAVSS